MASGARDLRQPHLGLGTVTMRGGVTTCARRLLSLTRRKRAPRPPRRVARTPSLPLDLYVGSAVMETLWGLRTRRGASAVSCQLSREMYEVCTAHPGRSCYPALGGSRVRTTDYSPEVQNDALPGSIAEAKPKARQVPLQSREARNEAMGLPSNQVADERASRDMERTAAEGRSSDTSRIRHWRMDVYSLARRSVGLKHRQWILRWVADGLRFHADIRSRVHEILGNGRPLATLGANHRRAPSAGQWPWLWAVAVHRRNLRSIVTLKEGAWHK